MPRKNKLQKNQPPGSRSASGRKRDRTPQRVQPCDGILRRRDLYQVAANDTDTCDALGRAYTAGLLGSGEHAKDLLVAGRRIAAQYWRVFGFTTPDSLARFQPVNPSMPMDPAVEKIREDALNDALRLVRARGHSVSRAFEQLVIGINPDQGPKWLDAIVWAHRHHRRATEGEYNMMRLALEGLEEIA